MCADQDGHEKVRHISELKITDLGGVHWGSG